MEIQAIYAAQQEQFLSLVLDHGDRSATRVPACPDWEVRDVVAHVAGLASDAATGGLPEMDLLEQWRDDVVATARDAMTAEQVRRSDDRAIQEIASDWKELLGTLAPMLRGTFPFPDPAPFGLSAILVTDLAVHDQDVRGALGAPRGDNHPSLSLALATYSFGVDYRIRQLDLPALAVDYEGKRRILGAGEPMVSVTADQFELFRAFGGRRSRRQILAFDWEGDPGPYLALIPAYGERDDDLIE
jgi:uncharacterized protein (TIGR03083 family)